MQYQAQFKPKAIKDLQSLPTEIQQRILAKIELMQDHLQGDVKKLTNSTPEYRLRVGDYRVLFEMEGQILVIYRVKHRKMLTIKKGKAMLELHPEFLTKDGRKEFAVLPYEEFLKIQELLEDLQDLQDLRETKQEEVNNTSVSLEIVKIILKNNSNISS